MTRIVPATHEANNPTTDISVVVYDKRLHKDKWDEFVQASMNGTAFHKQQFLSYHEPGKFDFHHLLFYDDRRLVAVLPGGYSNDRKLYESPVGASYGSFVVEDISAETSLRIVAAFEEYIRVTGVEEVSVTATPVIYQPVITQNLDFALLYCGYHYQRHYLSHVASLRRDKDPIDEFHPVARRYVHRTRRNYPDLEIEFVEQERMHEVLDQFYPIMLANKEKHSATPTHSLRDLHVLHDLMPDMIKLWIARYRGEIIAGTLVFIANDRVPHLYYPMLKYDFRELRPIYVLTLAAMQWSALNGYPFFDFGVSQDKSDANPMTPALSLIQFKEKFNSRGVLRSTLTKRYKG